jgi:uncharacterized protein (TIGR02145 family)
MRNDNDLRACTGNGYATTATNAIAYLAESYSTYPVAASAHGCGYLYNWYGATAGTGASGLVNVVATGSICPTGWHLPTYRNANVNNIPSSWGTDKNEVNSMMAAAGNTRPDIIGSSSKFRAITSGGAYPGNYVADQSFGFYWSSSADTSSGRANYIGVNVNAFSSGSNTSYTGYAVRCILNAN